MLVMTLPVPIAVGTDGALTADDLGWRLDPLHWWREFLVSGFHFGVIGAVVASWLVRDGSGAGVVVRIFLLMHALVIVTLLTAWILAVILRKFNDERIRLISYVKEDERRRRAHWLHDDVCAQIRLVSLRVQTQAIPAGQVVHLLDELDHQLRLRQLDELFVAGSVRAAEVLQPYIRHAQNLGVDIDSVPAFEQAALVLNEPEARLLARVASVLTSNALNAGSTRLSIALDSTATRLRLSVRDDGPGFGERDVQPGRGLWVLREDLKPGGIEIDSSASGSTVVATIALEERSRLVDDLVG
jgi:signal transduction histidine kinase